MKRTIAILWPLCGIALVGVGAWWIYQPAGLIAVGSLLIIDTWHSQRRTKK